MAAEGIQVELSGVDVEQVFLDIFFVGFRSGAATTFKTICMNSLHWSEDRADRAAEDASAEINGYVITDKQPLADGFVPLLAHWATCTKKSRRTPASATTTNREPAEPALF